MSLIGARRKRKRQTRYDQSMRAEDHTFAEEQKGGDTYWLVEKVTKPQTVNAKLIRSDQIDPSMLLCYDDNSFP